MSLELSYVLITPYTIAKSRTGGILSRLLSRTNLELVGAQVFTPDEDFVREYAESLRPRDPMAELHLLSDYVEENLGPSNGRRHRSVLLLFRGENPCEQLVKICGHIYTEHIEVDAMSAETIRETYSDLIFSKDNPTEVSYFEPAVLTPRLQEDANADLLRFARFLEKEENIVKNVSYPDPSKIEQTLVIIKPDNWDYNSSRPGAILEMFSRTGLRIIGLKVHRFSLAQAMEFYGPVEAALKEKFSATFGKNARETLEKEYKIKLSPETENVLSSSFGIEYAQNQFAEIIEFMSGSRPRKCTPEESQKPGNVKCMIIVYEGEDAIKKIRDVLGPTDPLKAPDGTVRREFGKNVMVNTAHASDSRESYDREKAIVKIRENSLSSIIREYI
ncbi:MAG TPA: nucleoside-diphosphate kinase [Treponema sp.]|nr:nucleoside-diphosphate kinase [Treponema sp.]